MRRGHSPTKSPLHGQVSPVGSAPDGRRDSESATPGASDSSKVIGNSGLSLPSDPKSVDPPTGPRSSTCGGSQVSSKRSGGEKSRPAPHALLPSPPADCAAVEVIADEPGTYRRNADSGCFLRALDIPNWAISAVDAADFADSCFWCWVARE